MNLEMFGEPENSRSTHTTPLAERSRPQTLDGILGHDEVIEVSRGRFTGGQSIVFYGPPGVGKTTIALNLIRLLPNKKLVIYRPAIETLSDLKKFITSSNSSSVILFIDEIHRMDKRQQDYLLPLLESGEVQLIGATTENPFVFFNKAVISRVSIQELSALGSVELNRIVDKVSGDLSIKEFLTPSLIEALITFSNGDSRKLINSVEVIYLNIKQENLSEESWLNQLNLKPDFDTNRHYDLLSALIKSMRASQVDESIGWLSQYLFSGGDPLIIARRLIVFSSEDVGNAVPFALTLCVSTLEAVKCVGMPEARIALAQTVGYLARAPKSRASMNAIHLGMEHARKNPNIPIPNERLNKKNKTSHPEPNFPEFYIPSGKGHEI